MDLSYSGCEIRGVEVSGMADFQTATDLGISTEAWKESSNTNLHRMAIGGWLLKTFANILTSYIFASYLQKIGHNTKSIASGKGLASEALSLLDSMSKIINGSKIHNTE